MAARSFTGGSLRKVGLLWLLVATILGTPSGRKGSQFSLPVATAASADNDLFSSNVVTLTSSNWKQHVVDNPHMVLINICRKGEWEKLAASVKGMVTIAYWDTQGGSRPPRLLGEYQGTPTIRLFTPKRKPRKAGSVAEKTVLDYQHGERTAKDMMKFLDYQLPNYAERVKFGREDYDRLAAKAQKFGLPLVVVFSTKTATSTSVKWLSAEFRRRLLLVEVPPTDKNEGLREQLFGTSGGSGDVDSSKASLYVVAPDGGIVRYEGESFARRKLHDFMKNHALKEPVLEAPKTSQPPPKQEHDEF